MNDAVRTKLILVRHGATAANLSRPYALQGSKPDSELIAQGHDQARAAAQALAGYRLARIYCSPLKRARTTAEAIAARAAAPLEVVEGLIEADIGLWTGLTWEEIEKRWPAEYRDFHDDAETNGYLGGENLAQVRQRILPTVEALVAAHPGETIAVVGHGVVNRVLLAHWLGLPLRHARSLPQDNGGISVVEFEKGRAKVITVNAAGHLCRAAA
jgi:broad specificity phosphatase PhoE